MTVYVLFILNGMIDIMLHRKLYKMPNGIDYIVSAVAWAGFGFLFISHTHGKTNISIFYHKELGCLAIVVAVITLMQYKCENNTLIALTRGCCCTLAGTWLYQVILKSPKKKKLEAKRSSRFLRDLLLSSQ